MKFLLEVVPGGQSLRSIENEKGLIVLNIKCAIHARKAFTISEVALAVGIIAFGLVAIFSILPYGIEAQRDSQDQTIIQYEAAYWSSALRSGGLPLGSINRVGVLELNDDNGSYYQVDNNRTNAFERDSWAKEVCGWLSIPDQHVKHKYVMVESINGSLSDKLSVLPPGGFNTTFRYILRVGIENNSTSLMTTIRLNFSWPVDSRIEALLSDDPEMHKLFSGGNKFEKNKEYVFRVALKPRPALTIENLKPFEREFLGNLVPGDKYPVKDLSSMFPPRKFYPRTSASKGVPAWDGNYRQVVTSDHNSTHMIAEIKVIDGGDVPRPFGDPNLSRLELSKVFTQDDVGSFLIKRNGRDNYKITMINNNPGLDAAVVEIIGSSNSSSDDSFEITVLDPRRFPSRNGEYANWEAMLRDDFVAKGLMKMTGEGYYHEGLVSPRALLRLRNGNRQLFERNLQKKDYWPNTAPEIRKNRYWHLK